MSLYGIDLDGICFYFMPGFCGWLKDKVGLEIPEREEITSYYWFECIDGLDKSTFWDEFHKFGKAGGYRHLEIIPGTREGLQRLADAGHEIMYITSRPNYTLEDTRGALEEHDFPFRDRLVFADGAKAPVIREYGVDVFIDDSPRTIVEICKDTQARIYCMDYPMNQDIAAEYQYTRVHSWEQFLECEKIV